MNREESEAHVVGLILAHMYSLRKGAPTVCHNTMSRLQFVDQPVSVLLAWQHKQRSEE